MIGGCPPNPTTTTCLALPIGLTLARMLTDRRWAFAR
jgi:hypothetical protein